MTFSFKKKIIDRDIAIRYISIYFFNVSLLLW
nr:MAG TPA: hypothetical protein [Myoviridae sp. ctNPX13]